MTKYFTKKVLTTYFLNLLLIYFSISVSALNSEPPAYLNPNFGPDSISRIQCAHNLSNMAEYMKIGLPEYAAAPWRTVFEEAPKSRENIYIIGAKIYQYYLSNTDDLAKKEGLYDTLMLIYDRRIQYFGKEPYVLGRKAVDILKYKDSEFEKAYEAFSRSAELAGSETSLNVVTGLAQTGAVMLNKNLIESDEFLSKYFYCREIISEKEKNGESRAGIRRSNSMLDKVFESVSFSDCESLQAFFEEKVSSDSLNSDLIQISLDLLIRSGCENSAFFADLNIKLLELRPESGLAYRLAKFYLGKEDFQNAALYFIKAIDMEEDLEKKALHQYQLAQVYLTRLDDPQKARYYAKRATETNTNWGEPYLLISAAIVEGIKSCDVDPFAKQAINWLAVDYCIKAKSIDPSLSQKANDLISKYQSNFPNVEETFFRSLKKGDSYSFKCWIDESTNVR